MKKEIIINDNKITKADWIAFALLAGLCFFTMQQGDILHTGGSSFALLRGHVLDFYEYNKMYFGGNNYMISTYVLFAIWNIPLQLLGFVDPPSMSVPYGVLMWYKALPTIFFFLSAYVIFKIAGILGADVKNAKLAAFIFLTTPMAFFSQFCFGQYDVFTVFFMLIGLLHYFRGGKHHMIWFSLLFGIACTFKYYALLFYIPLLLLKEKRILKIIHYGLSAISPLALCFVPMIFSSAFKDGVLGFGAVSYIFTASIERFGGDIYLIPLLWVSVCVYAYLKDTNGFVELFEYASFVCSVVVMISFGLSFWHPQWLMITAPFMTLSLFNSNKKDIICVIDIGLMLTFTAFTVNTWQNHVDQHLFGLGAFGNVVSQGLTLGLKMRDIFILNDVNLWFTCFSCLLLARTILAHPKAPTKGTPYSYKAGINWVRGRAFVGICIFVIPMFVCFVSALCAPNYEVNYSKEAAEIEITLTEGQKTYDSVQFPTWSDENGQDDIIWYEAIRSANGKWTAIVDLRDHFSVGNYSIHIYADGKCLGGTSVMVDALTE